MKARQGLLVVMLTGIMALTAAGCGSVKFDPQENSIFVKEDRTVTSAEFVSIDNSEFETPRYDQDEMQSFLEDTVKKYNQETCGLDFAYADDAEGDLRVSVEEFSVENNIAKAILNYASAEDYLNFNGTENEGCLKDLIIGTVQNGIDSGLDFSGMVNADGEEVSAEDVQDDAKYTLVAVTGSTRMVVDGTVRYVSAGVTVEDDNTVIISGDSTVYVIFH